MRTISNKRNKILLLFPAFLFFTVFFIYPMLNALQLSFTNFSGIGESRFIGLANYKRLLQDPIFGIACQNTLVILLMGLFLMLPLAFFWAYVIDMGFTGSSLIKAATFSPYVIAPIIIGTIWWFLLDPTIGLINAFLRGIGLSHLQQIWIGGKTLTPYSVGIMWIWQASCFHSTIILAGMKSIPTELYPRRFFQP